MSIKGTAVTMGRSSPATLAEDAAERGLGVGYYVYRGSKPLESDPEVAHSPKSRNMASLYTGKAERLAEFKRLIEEEDKSWEEAGERVGIARQTARHYNQELRQQKAEAGKP